MNEKPKRRPEVFSYHDYRALLRAWLAFLATRNAKHSMRAVAREAQLSCAYLPTVLAGKRRLTEKALRKLLPLLRMSPLEASYLELLVKASEGNRQEREQALEQIQQMRAYRKANPKESESFRYLTRWSHVVIRELASLADFRPEVAWIQQRLLPRVSPHEIRNALGFLFSSGFLIKSAEGKARPAEKDIRCEGSVFRSALRRFHQEMIQTTLAAVELSPPQSHLVLGHTVALRESQFAKVREILSEAIRQIESLGQQAAEAEKVFHVTVLSAPLTRLEKEPKS